MERLFVLVSHLAFGASFVISFWAAMTRFVGRLTLSPLSNIYSPFWDSKISVSERFYFVRLRCYYSLLVVLVEIPDYGEEILQLIHKQGHGEAFRIEKPNRISITQQTTITSNIATMGDSAYSFSLTTFSRTGKLLQIEYALNAVANGRTSLGICAKDGVVIATDKKLTSELVDVADVHKVELLTPSCGVCYAGVGPDFRVLGKLG